MVLLTAARGDLDIRQADLLDGCPPEDALRAMTVLCSTYMQHALPVAATGALRSAGVFAGRLEADQ